MSQNTEYIVRSPLPPKEYAKIPVGQYFAEELAKYDQNSAAIINPKDDTKITLGELFQQSQAVANSLLQLGISSRDVFLFYADNSPDYAISMFSAIYLGLTVVQCASANGPFEVSQQLIEASGTALVIGSPKLPVIQRIATDAQYSNAFKQVKYILILNADEADDQGFLEHPALNGKKLLTFSEALKRGNGKTLAVIPHFRPENLAKSPCLITFTSGTSGSPKGAVHSHLSFLSWLVNLRFKENLTAKLIACANPMSHISGLVYTLAALLDGMSVVLFNKPTVDQMMAAVERLKINHLIFGANNATEIANEEFWRKYDLSSLELMKYGSSKVAANLLLKIKNEYRVRLYEVYGATEFCGHLEFRDLDQLDAKFQPHNLGCVVPGVELKVIDLNTGESLPPNQQGEICFRGPQCFIGYLNNEQATKSTIDADGWYHSGDVGYYTEHGNLFISDRIKEMIKYSMWSICPAEIEDFLHQHAAVEAVCVVGVPHLTDGQLIRAYVVVKQGASVTETELINFVKENMGFQKQLRGGVRFIPKMARTPVGKVDRSYFKNLVKDELITEAVE